MKLKQVAMVAGELAPVRKQIFDVLGVKTDYDDPGVGEFGLCNSVMAIGETFLEVVCPKEEGTTAARLLERRGGDGGYMVIALVDNIQDVSRRIENLQMRKIWEVDREEVSAFHVHPKDIGAAIVSFDEMRPSDEWLWAGPGWRDRKSSHVGAITAVDVQADDPEAIATLWARAFGGNFYLEGDVLRMPLDGGEVRFIEAADGRGDGVAAIEFSVIDGAAIMAAAESHQLSWFGNELMVCGTRFRFLGLR
ncbi:hypothetical protein OAL10_10025 [Gammaproteobacteria bacterium]|nr:hypothetical protein [Gammaproteobacteria bacterium]